MPRIHGDMIFNLGVTEEPPDVQGHQTWQTFRAPAGTTRYFRQFSVMLGCEGGARGDLAAQIVTWKETDTQPVVPGSIEWVISHGWDHYADPTAPTPGTYDAPDEASWEVGPGDVMGLALLWIPFYYRPVDGITHLPGPLTPVVVGGPNATYYPKVIAQFIGRWTIPGLSLASPVRSAKAFMARRRALANPRSEAQLQTIPQEVVDYVSRIRG